MPFGVRYLKASPTTYVFQFVNGKAKRSGPGLSFFYMPSRSVIVQVPLSSVDVPFVFNEISADFQDITIQGQITYRVTDPQKLVQHLEPSVYPKAAATSRTIRKNLANGWSAGRRFWRARPLPIASRLRPALGGVKRFIHGSHCGVAAVGVGPGDGRGNHGSGNQLPEAYPGNRQSPGSRGARKRAARGG